MAYPPHSIASQQSSAHPADSGKRRLSPWLLLAVIVSMTAGYPLWLSLLVNADFVDLANEPVAYRYFFVERVWGGENIVVPVGILVSLFHHVAYWIANRVLDIGSGDLRSLINAFALATNAQIFVLQTAIFVAAAVSRRLNGAQKTMVMFVGIALQFAFGFAGFDYTLMPDYLHLNMVIAVGALYAFLEFWARRDERPSATWLLIGPFVAGVVIANKISLAPLVAVALAPLLFAGRVRPLALARRFGAFSVLAICGFGLVHLLAYGGRPSGVMAMLPGWWAFVQNPGGEPGFWQGAFALYFRIYNYREILPIYPVMALLAGGALLARRTPRLDMASATYLVNIFAVAFYVYALYKRPAGTTLFESTQWILCLSAMLAGMTLQYRFIRYFAALAVVAIAGIALYSFPLSNTIRVTAESRERANVKEAFFNRTKALAGNRLMTVLFKDNSMHHEGLHELLLKGAAEFPTWRIAAAGDKLLKKYVGQVEFRSEYEQLPPIGGPIAPNSILVVFQGPQEGDDLSHYPGAKQFAMAPGVREERWKLHGKAASGSDFISGRIFYAGQTQ